MREKIIDIGNVVLCDGCNDDFTAGENAKVCGGILVGSSAYCPRCAPDMRVSLVKYNELDHLEAECPEGMAFRDWVLGLRGGDNTIKIRSFDKDEEIF